MPELPEVETIRGQLAPLVVGRVVTDADSHPSTKFVAARETVGLTFTGLTRRGKYLLFDTDGPVELVAHLGMTGRFVPGTASGPHRRAWWGFDDGTELAFVDVRRFGRLAVVPRDDHSSIATLARLGPEPLGPDFTPGQLHEALARSRRAVKTQLLSQRPVAGVGNIYADEALWLAGISPRRRRLGRARCDLLHDAIRSVLSTALDHGGTTLRDYRTVDGGRGTNQHRLNCYGRGGQPCPRCATPLTSGVLDGRGTTWCRCCQR